MIRSLLLFARSTPHHHTGGMETLAWNLARECARSIESVTVLTTAIAGASGAFREAGVTVVPLGQAAAGKYSRAWWVGSRAYWRSLPTAPDAALSVSAAAFSVVGHRAPHETTPFAMQAHGTSAMEIGSKLRAHDLRSLATFPRNLAALVRDLDRYRKFDLIIPVGEPVRRSLAMVPQRWSARPAKVHGIPNAVRLADHQFDPAARARTRRLLGIADSCTVVACVGRLHVQKRLDRVLRAVAALRDRRLEDRFRILLVGDGPDERRLQAIVDDLRIGSMVRFAGRIEADVVRDYYAAADVSLMTTARREGLPMAMLEALASGLPTLVPIDFAERSGLSNVVTGVDPADPQDVADALCRLPSAAPNPVSRPSLLPDEFHLEHCAQAYLAKLAGLVRARP